MTGRYSSLSNLFLKVSDLLVGLAALGLTITYRYAPTQNPTYLLEYLSQRVKVTNAILGFSLLLAWHVAFAAQGLYVSHRLSGLFEELKEVVRAVAICGAALLIGGRIGSWPTINVRTVGIFCVVSIALMSFTRFVLRFNLRWLRERGHNAKTMLILGGGARGRRLASQLSRRTDLGYKLIGYLDSDPALSNDGIGIGGWLGPLEDLPKLLATEVIDEVAITLPIGSQYANIEWAVGLLEEQGLTAHLVMDFFPQKIARSQPADLDGTPIVSLCSTPGFSWRTEAKRVFDLFAGTLLLIFSLPLFVVVALAIKLDSPGPVFFVQERIGLNKRRFRMLKFRTMSADAEDRMGELEHLNEKAGPIFKIRKDPRITRLGRLLRKTSIDELPQLVNVFLGQMSIVGPRPLSSRDAAQIEEAWQKRRFSMKPGLTCLWQISGRSELSFERWVELDLQYIDNWSLALDLGILLRTIPAIVLARGAS